MPLSISFAGKRILITGGANGLGRALVKKFYEDKAIVFTVDKDEHGLLSLKMDFPGITTVVTDLSDWDSSRKVIQSLGIMDHLVNNAGLLRAENFMEITKPALDLQLNVNYAAMINVAQVVAKGMIDSKIAGSIVNISSVGDRIPIAGMAVYACTKAAVTLLTKAVAVELGSHNIRVNCICPGAMNTELFKDSIEKASGVAKCLETKGIIKRPMEPSEAADLVFFLLSPFAGMITGEDVVIDGGLCIT